MAGRLVRTDCLLAERYTVIQQRIPDNKDRPGRPIFAVRVGWMVREHMSAGTARRMDGARADARGGIPAYSRRKRYWASQRPL